MHKVITKIHTSSSGLFQSTFDYSACYSTINMQSLVSASKFSFTSFSFKHEQSTPLKVGNFLGKMMNQNLAGSLGCKENNLSTNYMAISTPQTPWLYHYEEDLRMNKYYEVELQAKEEEVDASGTVKSDVYSRFCQEGYDEMTKNVGLAFSGNCKSTSLSSFSSKIYTPLKLGDKFSVKVKVSCISTTSIYVETYIFRIPDNELTLEAEAEIVLLGKNDRPVRISPGVRAKLLLLDSLDLFD